MCNSAVLFNNNSIWLLSIARRDGPMQRQFIRAPMDRGERYRNHLRRQLAFLSCSCDAYDKGFQDEAIRIAVVLRVLIHDTKSSTSLLTHLCCKNINLLSTVAPIYPGAAAAQGMALYSLGANGAKFGPILGEGWYAQPLQVVDWWHQTVAVFLKVGPVTRRDIVLGAANRDGGAHVDRTLTPTYTALSEDGALGSLVYQCGVEERVEPLASAHLVYLRQMGYEVLHSIELVALAQ